jgi:hypothetical protein
MGRCQLPLPGQREIRLASLVPMGLAMFDDWPAWALRFPSVRRVAIKMWRMLLRVQRATLAKAVLVLRREDGSILVLASPSGELALPAIELDAWRPVTTQVEALLGELLQERPSPALSFVNGTPGAEGVTFVYAATIDSARAGSLGGTWLAPEMALRALPSRDRLLLLSEAD